MRSIDPARGTVLETHTRLRADEIEHALASAADAFAGWRGLALPARGELLRGAAARLREQADAHAETMALEMGKPLAEGRAEIEKCAWVCEFYADHAREMLADAPVETDAVESWVQYEPLGPVLAIMPWNFPWWQVFRFAAPALMAGNVGLLKHAENVQRCARSIQDLLREAGAPAGVFQNLAIESDQVGDLIRDPRVRAVTLTGSERAGSEVAAQVGRALKKVVLELGGSDPLIVLDDVSVPQVAEQAARARTINGGQSCIAAKRFIVVRPLEKPFVDALRDALESLRVGDPRDPTTDLGPLAREDLREALHAQVTDSVSQGARLVTGGRIPDGEGFFYPPTLLTDVRPGMRVAEEETFGPVAAVIAVEDDEEAVRVANASRYGLGASVWSGDRARGVRLAQRLEAGCVAVNGIVKSDPRLPFGGIKRSGFGRELGREGLLEFVNVKSVWTGDPV